MSQTRPDISVVVPVYMGESFIVELVDRVKQAVDQLGKSCEIILVNDASPDNSIPVIQAVCKEHSFVKGLLLSRNFGQHYAIHAGLQSSTGEWVVVMDCDLQDKPEEIPKLYKKTTEGYDIVLAQRIERQDTYLKRLSSSLFYKVFGYFTDTQLDSSVANFGIYNRKVVQAICDMHDQIRYFPTMVQWVGFSKTKIPVEHSERPSGSSSYSVKKLFRLAFNNIIAFSDKPLRLSVKLGLIIAFSTGLIGCFYLIQFFRGEIKVLGFTSLIISIWFLSGLIIFILGVIGIYLGKVFAKVKGRPDYIIDQKLNFRE
ncbi:MAG: glycosyltransferase family 2 protein [Bacteroidota bacterium]